MGRLRVAVALGACAVLAFGTLGLSGCAEEGGPAPPVVAETPDWHHSMSADELRSVAETLGLLEPLEIGEDGLVVDDGLKHADLVTMLEQHTGCGCFGATCGVGYCDHACGACMNAADSCFAGVCENTDTCAISASLATVSGDAGYVQSAVTYEFGYAGEVVGDAFEQVRIRAKRRADEPLAPGTYDLRLLNPQQCELCVVGQSGCGVDTCDSTWVATSGYLEIDEALPDGTFTGRVVEAKFQQGYEDPKTDQVYPLAQGDHQCVGELVFEAPVEAVTIDPAACEGGETGVGVGQRIADFALQNCHGEWVNLHDFCGTKAIWMVAAADW